MNRNELIEKLGREELPQATHEDIVAQGEAAALALIEVLKDEALGEETSPGEGWVPVHAATLLGDMQHPAAVEPMLETLSELEWDTYLANSIVLALPLFGAAALEPTLQCYDTTEDPFMREACGEILARLGVNDERLYERLIDGLRTDADYYSGLLALYGDRRAVPALESALEAMQVPEKDPHEAAVAIMEVACALTDLGVELSEAQQGKVAQAEAVLPLDMDDHIHDDTCGCPTTSAELPAS